MASLAPDSTPPTAAKLEVLERVRSFAALRGAQSALEPSACAPGALPAAERWRDIRERLGALSKRVARGGAAAAGELRPELAEIDERLAGLRRGLLGALDGIALPQLRAPLPLTFREYSDEVVALLDPCVSTESGRADRVRITEYLTTMIASEQCAGVRRMVRDPVHISAALSRYSNSLGEALDHDTDPARVAERFDDAARRLQEASNVRPVLDEVRALKEELGEAIFAPQILRAVVDYNLEVWNRHEDMLDQARTNDWIADSELILSIEVEFEDEPQAPISSQLAQEPREDEEQRASSQREGIARIEDAIASRLSGKLPEDELLQQIISGLELSEREQQAFAARDASEIDELFRAMVATGTAVRRIPTLGTRFSELDLRPAILQSDWVRRLNERVRITTKQLIARGAYADASEVSATKRRFLYASLAELIRNATRKAGASDTYIEGAGEALQHAAAHAGSWAPLDHLPGHQGQAGERRGHPDPGAAGIDRAALPPDPAPPDRHLQRGEARRPVELHGLRLPQAGLRPPLRRHRQPRLEEALDRRAAGRRQRDRQAPPLSGCARGDALRREPEDPVPPRGGRRTLPGGDRALALTGACEEPRWGS